MMKEFGFEKGEKWQYDPHHVILNRRVEVSFVHSMFMKVSQILRDLKINKYGAVINLHKHLK